MPHDNQMGATLVKKRTIRGRMTINLSQHPGFAATEDDWGMTARHAAPVVDATHHCARSGPGKQHVRLRSGLRSRLAVGHEGGTHVTNKDGGPEFERDALGIITEPEGGVFFQFFVRQKLERFPVDLVHPHAEAD